MKQFIAAICFFTFSYSLFSQEYFPKNTGVETTKNAYTVITNAIIHSTSSKVINNGVIIIKDGKITDIGSNLSIPKNALKIDAKGKHIYPAFIDIYTHFGIEKPKRLPWSNTPQYDTKRKGYYWNDHVLASQDASIEFKFNAKQAKSLKNIGFSVVNTHIPDGIARGNGALISLNDNDVNGGRVLNAKSAQYFSLSKSNKSHQAYPTSLMGSLALLRQLHYDANWYANGHSKTLDKTLEAYNNNKNLAKIMAANNRANAIRVSKVAKELGINYLIVGGGDEYQHIESIKQTNASYIIPVNFPKAYDVSDGFLANALSLSDMRHWEQAPYNPYLLAKNNINFAFTTHDLKDLKSFLPNIQNAIKHGLDKDKALDALTLIPARLINQSNSLGSLKKGAYANFNITSAHPLDRGTIYYENWTKGERYPIKSLDVIDVSGTYNTTIQNNQYALKISGDAAKPKLEVTNNNKVLASSINIKDNWLQAIIRTPDSTKQEVIKLSSKVLASNKNLNGIAILPNGNQTSFFAKRDTALSENKKDEKAKTESNTNSRTNPLDIVFPNNGYGFKTLPKQETILFKNATIWTNEDEGVLEETDLLIKNGRIAKIGKNLSYNSAKVIDASGKHITAGIIDEHSHIATDAVNEAGQNSSAEVSIEDVVNSEDLGIYRNLAGGVTSIQILHGSANPIGGQSAIIKLKWGLASNDLIYKNSPKFIKFALGENVKQSNWGDNNNIRFPQTRMGVEQVFIDYFSKAKAYDEVKKSGQPYRKDLELEALLQILNKERFISCHSYVQSEINMLMKVAEMFNFNINTFTHILEGYKVADKMKAHGVGGSTFSDWWAYKFEVNDAIPYNAAIMHNQGIVTAINSDDSEMSRRLNQEAAKSVKYGGVSEEDAWKFVTLNPAKLLHIDNRVGSLKVGKDADVVLWSEHPMSIYSKAEKTIIEGVVYFDIERDKQLRDTIKQERNRLINKMLFEKQKGLKTQPVTKKEHKHAHCDSDF